MSSMEQTFSDYAIACGCTTGIDDPFQYDTRNLLSASVTLLEMMDLIPCIVAAEAVT